MNLIASSAKSVGKARIHPPRSGVILVGEADRCGQLSLPGVDGRPMA